MTGSIGDSGGPAASDASTPTCYRHTDRETYIRCARCERHICPDCMNAAPVGFQCPECVAQGSKSVRQPTTVLGGEVREHGDLVTKLLVAVNVVVWLVGMVFQTSQGSLYALFAQSIGANELSARLGLVQGSVDDRFAIGVVDGEWYRLLTAAFVHEQIWHIGMNMLALWVLGTALEPALGRWRFVALYVLSALGGTAASLLAAGAYSLSYGASGAVFGLMGALFVVMRKLGRETGAVVVILGINLVIGFTVQGIDWRAHLGGLVIGSALAAAFAYAPRQQRRAWGIAACALATAIIAAAVAIAVNN